MKMMLAIAGVGLVVGLGGLMYGVFAVGVPYQDPTATQAASERANGAISGWAMGSGAFMFLTGLVGFAIQGVRRYRTCRTNPPITP
jgi:hypothetical protein